MTTPRFKAGDTVTFKDRDILPDKVYSFSGGNMKGKKATVIETVCRLETSDCHKIRVKTDEGAVWVMLESEFVEYDSAHVKTQFETGDYIVTLKVEGESACAKDNYIFKIRKYFHYMAPDIDLFNSRTNGH